MLNSGVRNMHRMLLSCEASLKSSNYVKKNKIKQPDLVLEVFYHSHFFKTVRMTDKGRFLG